MSISTIVKSNEYEGLDKVVCWLTGGKVRVETGIKTRVVPAIWMDGAPEIDRPDRVVDDLAYFDEPTPRFIFKK